MIEKNTITEEISVYYKFTNLTFVLITRNYKKYQYILTFSLIRLIKKSTRTEGSALVKSPQSRSEAQGQCQDHSKVKPPYLYWCISTCIVRDWTILSLNEHYILSPREHKGTPKELPERWWDQTSWTDVGTSGRGTGSEKGSFSQGP